MEKSNNNNLVEAVHASPAPEKKGYEAFIASLNNLNSLPKNIKKQLIISNVSKVNKEGYNSHIFNSLRHYLLTSIRNNKYSNNLIFNLVDYITCLEYLTHQIVPINKIYDIPEVKQVYIELFKLLKLNPQDLITELQEAKKQHDEVLNLSAGYKTFIINTYHKLIIGNNIFYVHKDLVNQYGEKVIRNYYSQDRYDVAEVDSITSHLLITNSTKNLTCFKPENFIKKSVDQLTKSDSEIQHPTYPQENRKAGIISIDAIKKNLKDCMSLSTYKVSDLFFRERYLESINNLFSKLAYTNVLTKKFDSWKGMDQFNESITNIVVNIANSVTFTLDENIAVVKNKKLVLEYNPNNPFPTMEFQKGCTFEKLINDYHELEFPNGDASLKFNVYDSIISSSKRGVFHENIHKRVPQTFNSPNLIEKRQLISVVNEVQSRNLYGMLEVPLPFLDFGGLNAISKVIEDCIQCAIYNNNNALRSVDAIYPYLFIQTEVLAYNLEPESGLSGFLCNIDVNTLLQIMKSLNTLSFITPQIKDSLTQIRAFLEELLNKNVFEIYCYRKPGNKIPNYSHGFNNNNLVRSGGSSPFTDTSNMCHYSCAMGELVLNYPAASIKAFGNKTIKEKIYLKYKALKDDEDKDDFLHNLLSGIYIGLEKNAKEFYSSETLISKGFNVPVTYISLLYEGERYKFLLSDFKIIYKTHQYFSYTPVLGSKKTVKKLSLISGKTKFKSITEIPGKCTKNDVLIYNAVVDDLKSIYNSGNNKFSKVVSVKNSSTNSNFNVNLKNLKVYVEEKKSSKGSKN